MNENAVLIKTPGKPGSDDLAQPRGAGRVYTRVLRHIKGFNLMSETTTHTLIDDLRAVVSDAEALLAATAGDSSDVTKKVRHKAAASLDRAKASLEHIEEDLKERAKAMADDATDYVRENPWQSIGIAAAAGIVIGVLLGRR